MSGPPVLSPSKAPPSIDDRAVGLMTAGFIAAGQPNPLLTLEKMLAELQLDIPLSSSSFFFIQQCRAQIIVYCIIERHRQSLLLYLRLNESNLRVGLKLVLFLY
jgi:hypothetical protein